MDNTQTITAPHPRIETFTPTALDGRPQAHGHARRWRDLVARLVATGEDRTAALARVVFAAVLFPHGAQHLLGWFGGFGFSGTYRWMTGTLGFPAPAAAFGIVFELVGPLLLLAGVGGRLVAAGLGAFLAVAASTHRANGFFMNWLGNQAGEGWEYHALAVMLAVTIVARGAGAWSIDRWITRRLQRRPTE